MKWILIVMGFIFIGCASRPNERRLSDFKNNEGRIQRSFYKKVNDTLEFRRFIVNGEVATVQFGQIFQGPYGLNEQKIKHSIQLTKSTVALDSLSRLFQASGYQSKFLDDKEELIVQIVPDSTMVHWEQLGFTRLKQQTEEQIDARLKKLHQGEWFASDSPSMLFYVKDWETAIPVVVEVLKEEKLIDHILMARRIKTTPGEWHYEVIYPLEYEGVFNNM